MLNGHADQGQGQLNLVDQRGLMSSHGTERRRRISEMRHVDEWDQPSERADDVNDLSFEAMERELNDVEDQLTMRVHRLKTRLAEVKWRERFQRTVSLDRGSRFFASSSPASSQWVVESNLAGGAINDGRRQGVREQSSLEPKRASRTTEDATTAAVEIWQLRQRVIQLTQKEVALTLRADYLEHRLDVQTRIASATKSRQIRKATRESGLRQQTAAVINDSNSLGADAETGIYGRRESMPGTSARVEYRPIWPAEGI
jgi:hypothetical protein